MKSGLHWAVAIMFRKSKTATMFLNTSLRCASLVASQFMLCKGSFDNCGTLAVSGCIVMFGLVTRERTGLFLPQM